MKCTVLKTLGAAVLVGLASTSFASPDAQLELQPKPLEFSWFKRPVGSTSYVTQSSSANAVHQDYRFLTDYSPN